MTYSIQSCGFSFSLSLTAFFPAVLWLTGGPHFCHMPSHRCRKLTALNTGHIWVYNTPPFWDSTQSVDFKGLLHRVKIFKHSVKHSFEQEPIFFHTLSMTQGDLDSSLLFPQKQLQKCLTDFDKCKWLFCCLQIYYNLRGGLNLELQWNFFNKDVMFFRSSSFRSTNLKLGEMRIILIVVHNCSQTHIAYIFPLRWHANWKLFLSKSQRTRK